MKSHSVTATVLLSLLMTGCTVGDAAPVDDDLPPATEVTIGASDDSLAALGASHWFVSTAFSPSGAGVATLAATDGDGQSVSEITVEVGDFAAGEIAITIDGEQIDPTDGNTRLSHIVSLARADALRGGEFSYDLCAVEAARLTAAVAWWVTTQLQVVWCVFTDLGCESAARDQVAAFAAQINAAEAFQRCRDAGG